MRTIIDKFGKDVVPEEEATTKPLRAFFRLVKKRNAKGEIVTYKGRFCICGNLQTNDPDIETFAPVCSSRTTQVFLTVAAHYGLALRQADFVTAFLNSPLEEDVYVYPVKNADPRCPPGHVYKLKRAVYGLKQSPREWWKLFRDTLISLGWTQTLTDQCLFTRTHAPTNRKEMILVYVDDLLMAGVSQDSLTAVINFLASKFKMKDLGEPSSLLGMNITVNPARKTITVDQAALCQSYVTKFLTTTPLEELQPLAEPDYREQVGCIQYLAHLSRPDLAYIAGFLARATSNFTVDHCQRLQLTWRRLRRSINTTMTIDGNQPLNITTYTDEDWGSDATDRVSISRTVTFLGTTPIIWTSKKQPCVALSTMEAEFVALTVGCQDALWLRSLLSEISDVIELQKQYSYSLRLYTYCQPKFWDPLLGTTRFDQRFFKKHPKQFKI